jgi:hypothetical protein
VSTPARNPPAASTTAHNPPPASTARNPTAAPNPNPRPYVRPRPEDQPGEPASKRRRTGAETIEELYDVPSILREQRETDKQHFELQAKLRQDKFERKKAEAELKSKLKLENKKAEMTLKLEFEREKFKMQQDGMF